MNQVGKIRINFTLKPTISQLRLFVNSKAKRNAFKKGANSALYRESVNSLTVDTVILRRKRAMPG